MPPETKTIGPNSVQQVKALSSPADILFYGGSAGSGKSVALLLESMRHLSTPGFGVAIFRRTFANITKTGALWDQSETYYPMIGGVPARSRMTWTFPAGTEVHFAHLEHDRFLSDWQGSQIPLICIDEATEFSEKAFWFLLSRNRTTCGVRPYMRATCNPDPDSWLAEFLKWWIDQDSGYPIEERSGVLRWFVRSNDKLHWFNSARDAKYAFPEIPPKSVTFVRGRLEDNVDLMRANPEYMASLLALPLVEQERFLRGNWKIRPQAGEVFPRDRWKFIDYESFKAMSHTMRFCRGWDKAGTEKGHGPRSAGVNVAQLRGSHSGPFYIVHADAGRWADDEREEHIKTRAHIDRGEWGHVRVQVEQEPGSGGKHSATMTVKNLAGFDCGFKTASGSKESRWRPLSAQQRAGNVYIVQSDDWDWTDFIRELDALSGSEELDKAKLKDLSDGASIAFNWLTMSGAFSVIDGDLLVDDGTTPSWDDMSKKEQAEMPAFLRDIIAAAEEDEPGGADRRYMERWDDL